MPLRRRRADVLPRASHGVSYPPICAVAISTLSCWIVRHVARILKVFFAATFLEPYFNILQCGALKVELCRTWCVVRCALCVACSATGSGRVWVWGSNSHGQLGLGDQFRMCTSPELVRRALTRTRSSSIVTIVCIIN
jgi:hypothetical protein